MPNVIAPTLTPLFKASVTGMLKAPPGAAVGEPAVRLARAVTEELTAVESEAVALAEPPPDTLTEFTCGEAALAATFTVTAMGG